MMATSCANALIQIKMNVPDIIFLDYEMDPYSFALFKQYSLQCLGAGVGWEYYIIDPQETFGFDGSLMETFDQGIFNPYGIVQP